MRRRVWIWTLFAAVALAIMAGMLGWLLGTNEGARWVLSRVFQSLPVSVTAGRIEGCLAGNLKIEGVRIRHVDWEMGTGKGEISWRPLQLAFGQVAFHRIYLQGVSWEEKGPDVKPPDLTWPVIPRLLARVWGGVTVFQIDDFAYRKYGKEPVKIDRLQAKLKWSFGTATLTGLEVASPAGRLSGTLGAGFERPALFGELVLLPKGGLAGYDQISLRLRSAKARVGEQVSGEIRVMAFTGKEHRLSALGGLGIKRDGLALHEVKISEPGRSGVLYLRGEIVVSRPEIMADLQLRADKLRLMNGKAGSSASLSGSLALKGNLRHYEGRLALSQQAAARTWMSGALSGGITGNDRGLAIQGIRGEIFGGSVTGNLKWNWDRYHDLSWALQGRGLNPAKIHPGWAGRANVHTKGSLRWGYALSPRGVFRVALFDSVLADRACSGSIEANWTDGVLHVQRCQLRGRGFQLGAYGVLDERLHYQAQVRNFSGLVPGAAGSMGGGGWLRWKKGQWAGVLKGHAAAVAVQGMKVGSMDIDVRWNDDLKDGIDAKVTMLHLSRGAFRAEKVEATVQGKVSGHGIRVAMHGPQGDALVSLNGGYDRNVWQGNMTRGTLQDKRLGVLGLSQSALISFSRQHLRVTGLSFAGGNAESVMIDGDLHFRPLKGHFQVQWQKFNLDRANAVLGRGRLTGQATGSLSLIWPERRPFRFSASNTGTFTWTKEDLTFVCSQANARWAGNEKGTQVTWDLVLDQTGRFEGQFLSPEPAAFSLPRSGAFQASWRSVDIGLFRPLLDKAVDLQGHINGQIQGALAHGNRLEAQGGMNIAGGQVAWQRRQGVISSAIRRAVADFTWKEDRLKGNFSLDLAHYGQAAGSFQFPAPVHLPIKIDEGGQLRFQVQGSIHERGLLAAVFPGTVKESRGRLQFDLGADGTWKRPHFRGKARLEGAGASFPTAGIHLEDASAEVAWIEDQVRVQSFRVRSGTSSFLGSGTLWLKNWEICRCEGTLTGENVPTIYLPGMRLWTSPDIRFAASNKKLTVRGSIRVPKALMLYGETKGVIRSSRDVVITDLPKRKGNPFSMALDAQVTVILGDEVHLQMPDLQARLGGRAILKGNSLDKVVANGHVEILKGTYERYGVKLNVVRGRVVFKDESVDHGNLDILALKKVRDTGKGVDIEAGVTITGNLRSPLVKLYGRPAMSDRDVLSYMVIGRPYQADTGDSQKEQIAQWAAAIFAGSPSSFSFPRYLKEHLGIDAVGIETDPRGGMSRSLVTVGKYLSPDLYIALGRSLFGDDYYVSTRYSFLNHWQIESKIGLQSGADIFYRIEFD